MEVIILTQVGIVTHYYDKIGVAIVKAAKSIKSGDKLRFGDEENGFEQTADSMQFDHKEISEAKKGQEVGIKVEKKVKEGTPAYSA